MKKSSHTVKVRDDVAPSRGAARSSARLVICEVDCRPGD